MTGTITEKEFDNRFHMVRNHLDAYASLDGCMFETYGEENKYIRDCVDDPQKAGHLWTYMDDDNGNLCFTSGRHIINRIGYFMTKESHKGEDIYVKLDQHDASGELNVVWLR